MNKKITFRGVDHSNALEQYANKQLKKIEDFLSHDRTPITIDLIISPAKLHAHHRVELLVKSPSYNRVSHYEGEDLNNVLDRVIDVMYKELHEDKEKNHDKLKSVGRHEDFKKQR